MIWHDVEVSDDLIPVLLKLGLLEEVTVYRTTKKFDDALDALIHNEYPEAD